MKTTTFCISWLLIFLSGCSFFNSSHLYNYYERKNLDSFERFLFSENGSFDYEGVGDILYFQSAGYSNISGDTIFLSSWWKKDTLNISASKIDTLNGTMLLLEDFDHIPFEGKVIVDKQLDFSLTDGRLIIPMTNWREIQILTSDWINNSIDTLELRNNGSNSYLIKQLNTYIFTNYLFFDKSPFLIRGKKLIDIEESIENHKRYIYYAK
jgi:hypothetical protein